MAVGQNIFIDFEIIKKSEPEKLIKELDLLIILKNNIFVWSKTVPPLEMKKYCLSTVVDFEERELHAKITKLRAQKKTYKDISDTTGVPISKLGFYLTTNPNKVWSLDDWIKEYHKKDSMMFPKVDFVIDPNERFVHRFQLRGVDGNVVERID